MYILRRKIALIAIFSYFISLLILTVYVILEIYRWLSTSMQKTYAK